MLLIKSYHFQSAWNGLRTENNKSPRQLWLKRILENYSMTSTAVRDIFDINTTLYEKLSESLQALGVNLFVSVINNNMSLLSSSCTATLQISVKQELQLEDIISSEEKCNKEKYMLCVNVLSL